jgi:hypothetical protein
VNHDNHCSGSLAWSSEFFNQQPQVHKNDNEVQKMADIWFKLLQGLCNGYFELVQAPPGADSEDVINTDLSHAVSIPRFLAVRHGDIVGRTDQDVLILPDSNANWDIFEPGDSFTTYQILRQWVGLYLNIMENGEKIYGSPPSWSTYLAKWLDLKMKYRPFCREPFRLMVDKGFEIRWNETTFKLFLPRVGDYRPSDIRVALEGCRYEILASHRDTIVAQHVDSLITHLEDSPKFVPFDNHEPRFVRAVWVEENATRDLIPILQMSYYLFIDESSVADTCLKAVKLTIPDTQQLEILTDDEVLLRAVRPLSSTTNTVERTNKVLYPDFPVKARYIDLIDYEREHDLEVKESGNIVYRFHLKGRCDPIYHWAMADTIETTLFLWPKFKTIHWKIYYTHFKIKSRSVGKRPEITFFGISDVKRRGREDQTELTYNFNIHSEKIASASRFRSIGLGAPPEAFSISSETFPDGMGVFLTRLEPIVPEGKENWGLDFGASSSVISVANQDRAINLFPSGLTDQTKVYSECSEVCCESRQWFPTWSKKGPASEPRRPDFPSQLLFLNDLEDLGKSPAGWRYGIHYMLDFGNTLPEELSDEGRIIRDFKWDKDSENKNCFAYRRLYLKKLIEFCIFLRANHPHLVTTALPSKICLTCGLPLGIQGGESDEGQYSFMNKIVKDIEKSTGISIECRYKCQSHKSVCIRAPEILNVTADLGGDSIDLYGQVGDVPNLQFFESYRLGGHDLLSCISTATGIAETQLTRKLWRGEQLLENEPPIVADRSSAYRFINLLIEILARWFSACAMHAKTKAGAKEKIEIRCRLLGLGWNLLEPQFKLHSFLQSSIENRCHELLDQIESDVKLLLMFIDIQGNGWEKKTYLANNIALGKWHKPMLSEFNSKHSFLGANLYVLKGNREEEEQTIPCFKWYELKRKENIILPSDSILSISPGIEYPMLNPAFPDIRFDRTLISKINSELNLGWTTTNSDGQKLLVAAGNSPLGAIIESLRNHFFVESSYSGQLG